MSDDYKRLRRRHAEARARAGQPRPTGRVVEPTVASRPHRGLYYHQSSNLESLANLEQRTLGMSLARTPDEMMSSPTLREPKGTSGVALLRVEGGSLDMSRADDRLAMDLLTRDWDRARKEAVKAGLKPPSFNTYVVPKLRERGVDIVKNWSQIGSIESSEDVLINQSKAEVLKTINRPVVSYGKSLVGRLGGVARKGSKALGVLGNVADITEHWRALNVVGQDINKGASFSDKLGAYTERMLGVPSGTTKRNSLPSEREL